MKMDIINMDWDELMLRTNEFSPKVRGLIVKLINPKMQKAIFELRGRWDIPQKEGLNVWSFMNNLDYWGAPNKVVKNVKTTLSEDIEKNIMKPFNLPMELMGYMSGIVMLGVFTEETSSPNVLRKGAAKGSLQYMREYESAKGELNKEFGRPNFLSDHEAECGGTNVYFDSAKGKVIISHDVTSPFAEINELKTFIEQCKKNTTDFYKTSGDRKQTGGKQTYTFVVELILHKILDVYPEASNEQLLAKAQNSFKELFPNISLSKVKELPPLSDSPGFVKCVQRVKKARLK